MAVNERMVIYDICRKFELDHMPKVLVQVSKGCGPHRYVIDMGANSLLLNEKTGKWVFGKTTSRTVIFGKKEDLQKALNDVLTDMFKELYGEE